MAIARFKDLCIDATDPALVGRFYAELTARKYEAKDNGDAVLTGPTPEHRIWINGVPEKEFVKNRVHLDTYVRDLKDPEAIGATVVEAQHDDRGWTVMADPEGGEFCAFVRAELPDELVHGLVVDCADSTALAAWWAMVYEAELVHHASGYSTVQKIAGMPIETMDFVPVPEPKTVKNRVHWDVDVEAIEPLLDVGATLLRQPDDDVSWYVMADPEGNEFCAFLPR
jgi:hypothetical protein